LDQGQIDQAIDSYHRALQLNPNHAPAWNNLGLAFSKLRRYDEAITAFQRAVSIDPKYADAYNNLGAALVETKQLDQAVVAAKTAIAARTWSYSWKYGKTVRRTNLRNKLLPINPVLWLASRERWQLAGMWLIALLATGVFTLLILETPNSGWMILTYPLSLFMLLLYLGAASQSSRFFVDARRSGLIELLLATPLSERKIILGQWRALLRTFAIPVSVVLLLQLASSGLSHVSVRRMMAAAAASARAEKMSAVIDRGQILAAGKPRDLVLSNVFRYALEVRDVGDLTLRTTRNGVSAVARNNAHFYFAADAETLTPIMKEYEGRRRMIRLSNLEDVFLQLISDNESEPPAVAGG